MPLIWNALLAYVLLILLPSAFDTSLGSVMLFQPDVGWIESMSGIFAIAWALLRTGIIIAGLNKERFRLSG